MDAKRKKMEYFLSGIRKVGDFFCMDDIVCIAERMGLDTDSVETGAGSRAFNQIIFKSKCSSCRKGNSLYIM